MNTPEDLEIVYRIALGMIPGIGGITARKMLAYTGSPEALFREKKSILQKIPGVGSLLAERVDPGSIMQAAHEELAYIRKENITALYYQDPAYPVRLAQCHDAPLILYVRGNIDFNREKVLGIVGTRRPTSRGLDLCRILVEELAVRGHDPVIVSGLAYGIDHCAHISALKKGLRTIAVLGHGLRFMYPAVHRGTADRIRAQGSLVTDFHSLQKPERNNFIKRNRIIAGLSDAVVVVESGLKGGALITADLANSYYRDVFAYPGKPGEPMSAGCNQLIKTHKAAMIEQCMDLEYILGWEPAISPSTMTRLPEELSEQDEQIIKIIRTENSISVDEICLRSGMHIKVVSAVLLNLEFRGLISCLPGNLYKPVLSY